MAIRIAVVTDSTADIPPEVAQEKDIHVVPNIVIIEGRQYLDGIELSREEFYNLLPEADPHPTTSTASVGTYEQTFEKLLTEGYARILAIHVSSTFSSVFNNASSAASKFGGRVEVIDSQQLSLGLGFQVLEAANAISQDEPPESIRQRIVNFRQKIRVFAMLDTLEYLHRSGRVSWAKARIGNILRVKPFIEVMNGQAQSIGDVRTRRKGIQRLHNLVQELGSIQSIAILHSNAKEDAKQFLDEIHGPLPHPVWIVNVTTTIGTHVGPNALGFAAVTV